MIMSVSSSEKNPLRDKLDEDSLDLSLMQLSEVPVREMASLTKGTAVDLSNNIITTLPDTFPTLTHIIKLDLSKNQLVELPEYFGQLRSLRHLDLYSNQLERLPVSFGQLKNLKWLDLKNNPLVPALQQAAGPCITASDCAMCAKKVVALMQSMQSQLERERQRLIMEEAKVAAAKKAKEDAERERLRAEKRAAKERRREEARAKMENNGGGNGNGGNGGNNRRIQDNSSSMQHEMEQPRANGKANGTAKGQSSKKGGFFWSMLMFLLGLGFVCLATGISLLWIYTGGHLDEKNVQRAIPVIRKDVEITFLAVGKKAEALAEQSRPYLEGVTVKAQAAWEELVRRQKLVSHWVNKNLGPSFCSCLTVMKQWWTWLQQQVHDGWKWLKPQLWDLWLAAKPYFRKLGEFIIEQTSGLVAWIQKNGPIYVEWATQKVMELYVLARDSISGLVN